MGFKNADLFPTQITSTTPPGKAELHKIINIPTDADIAPGGDPVAILPASSTILGATLYYTNAGGDEGAGTVNVYCSRKSTDLLNPASGAEPVGVMKGAIDDVTNGVGNILMQTEGLPNIARSPELHDILVSLNTSGTVPTTNPVTVVIRYIP